MEIVKKMLFGLFFVSIIISSNELHAKMIAIIANSSYPQDAATTSDVKDIYLGEKEMIAGVKVRPFDQKESNDIKKAFLQKMFNISIDQYKNYWIGRIFQKGGIPPKIKDNSPDVINGVLSEKGGIGYVWMDEVKGKDGIKVLLTINVE